MNTPRLALIAFLIIITSSVAAAQENGTATPALGTTRSERLDLAVDNYALGLTSENTGLVESSLYYAVQLRLAYPERRFFALEHAIDRLVAKGATARVRYKAFLASTVYASPLLVDRVRVAGIHDADAAFAEIARELDGRLLVSKQ